MPTFIGSFDLTFHAESIKSKLLPPAFQLGAHGYVNSKDLPPLAEGFLNEVLSITGAAVLITYTMYVIHRPILIWSVPLCCYGLFRYILRVKSGLSGDPTDSLLKDPQLFVVDLLWVAIIAWGTYL